uniref:Uncharacterized protein n=1 Tax=Cucumis melo TaxID=3656 RepID=A0A9I9ECG5_CUCME
MLPQDHITYLDLSLECTLTKLIRLCGLGHLFVVRSDFELLAKRFKSILLLIYLLNSCKSLSPEQRDELHHNFLIARDESNHYVDPKEFL